VAQERKKRRIVLASILKPIDDTRIFEKMGVSLEQSGQYEVFIVGYPATAMPSYPTIRFIALEAFERLTLARLFARWKAFFKLYPLKPSLVVVGTHELLIPALLLKILSGTKIIYDVRENYFRNILYSGSFPWLVRWPLAMVVRLKEKWTAPFIDHFLLAEKGYDTEFRFHRPRWTLIENKALTAPHKREKKEGIRLLFSGTLSESTGVFRAILLACELHRLDATVSLTIVGHAALHPVAEKIQEEVSGHPFISLVGGKNLVPHKVVMESIQNSDFGIIAYPLSEHTKNSRPTKLFEYLAAELPIITESRWPWLSEFEACQPFVIFDFQQPDYGALLGELRSKQCYTRSPENVTWLTEAPKLMEVLEKL
jgi:hypothetical protein